MQRFFLFILWAVSAGAQAQTSPQSTGSQSTDAYWNVALTDEQKLQSRLVESQVVIPDPTSALNTVVIRQNGVDNRALLQTVGNQNRLEAAQTSGNNAADAVLIGSNNSVLLNQTGGGNAITMDLTGTNNRYLITQDGGDTANLQGLQYDNTRLELLQGSGNNALTVDTTTLVKGPFSTGIPNLRVEQTGGASVIIQQGQAFGTQP